MNACPVCSAGFVWLEHLGGEPYQLIGRCPTGHGRWEGDAHWFRGANVPDGVVKGRGWIPNSTSVNDERTDVCDPEIPLTIEDVARAHGAVVYRLAASPSGGIYGALASAEWFRRRAAEEETL